MEDTADSRIVNLVSNEGAVFPVPISAANLSVLVRTMINEISDASGGEGQKIKLPYTSAIVAKIIEFLRHHVEEPMRETKKVHTVNLCITSFALILHFPCVAIDLQQNGRYCSAMVRSFCRFGPASVV